MYRIVQEALNNAAKHGDARRAQVEVEEDDSTVRVTVRDDGHGFDPVAHTDGFGLVGMQERAELLQGTLEVTSSPGAGHDDQRRRSPPLARRRAPGDRAAARGIAAGYATARLTRGLM